MVVKDGFMETFRILQMTGNTYMVITTIWILKDISALVGSNIMEIPTIVMKMVIE